MTIPPAVPQVRDPAEPVGEQAAVFTSADATVADMRAVARWTITANAAVGRLLLAGFPLAASEIGAAPELFLGPFGRRICSVVRGAAGSRVNHWEREKERPFGNRPGRDCA
ncbi:hypothetical protein GCM10010417_39770 [Streptomyces carpaticus]